MVFCHWWFSRQTGQRCLELLDYQFRVLVMLDFLLALSSMLLCLMFWGGKSSQVGLYGCRDYAWFTRFYAYLDVFDDRLTFAWFSGKNCCQSVYAAKYPLSGFMAFEGQKNRKRFWWCCEHWLDEVKIVTCNWNMVIREKHRQILFFSSLVVLSMEIYKAWRTQC